MSDANGTVSILNVGAGDCILRFDNSNPAETIRAARVIKDMLRRGYALLVEVERDGEKRFERALDFDEKKCEYIIADFDAGLAHEADMEQGARLLRKQHEMEARERKAQEEPNGQREQTEAPAHIEGVEPSKGRRGRRRGVPAAGTRAVSVGRSAGG